MRDASGNVKFDSIADLTDGSTVINQQETDYAQMTGEHKVVSVGTGSEDEYDGKDVKGQIALVKRGAITFSEKGQQCQSTWCRRRHHLQQRRNRSDFDGD